MWDWGPYDQAVTRWTTLLGRQPPHPVHPGPRGKPRLNPAFVEWMMGLPTDPGWVTGVPGLPRTAQLRALGNGVVPRQALHAMRELAADTARSGASNLLTSNLARAPWRHSLRARPHTSRPRPPPHAIELPHTAAPPRTHHHRSTPSPEKGTTMTHTDATTTWTETDTTTADVAAVGTHSRTPLLLTPDEAGALVRRSGGWMRRKAAAGDIPCTVLGRTILFSDTDLGDLVVMHHRPANR
ncbi:hypothetical protein [Yinghuangia seranimata]|uniref:hypothetical protein n=1 Tax=Yinghuangia seranimata TaxID=408067 RepID=UPI00248CD976|nr:hypothetical protein [Yinghuangia seranimata]MDI2130568.1 hypothetical protein [Yinghuangia seranimata]